MKKIKEKEQDLFLWFCIVIAVTADVLCVLFLLNVVQNRWFLNFIHALAVLLHLAFAVLALVRGKRKLCFVSAGVMAVYLISLALYNLPG